MAGATPKEQVQEKAQVAQEKLGEGTENVRSRMREQVDQRSTQAGEQVSSGARALRSTSERLREEGQDGPARAAERAADQAERLGGYLRESDADRILGDVEDFGRRQPMAVVAIGVAAGFMASRFLKASSSSRYAGRTRVDREPPALGHGSTEGTVNTGTVTPAAPMAGSQSGR
jgi:hypothetical protein